MTKTKIPWAQHVWNPVSGCTKISPGCKHCYAARMAPRLRGRFGYPEDDPFKVTIHYDKIDHPGLPKRPQRVFVCSMSDLFHKNVAPYMVDKIYNVAAIEHSRHTYIILTKRPGRMVAFWQDIANHDDILSQNIMHARNIWHLVSVENQEYADHRLPELMKLRKLMKQRTVLGVSVEPMLGPVDLRPWLGPQGLDWVICGCESGPGRRRCELEWIVDLRDQCIATRTPFFLKQAELNIVHANIIDPYKNDRGTLVEEMPLIDGVAWDQYPGHYQMQNA